jgi:hypothetical protein
MDGDQIVKNKDLPSDFTCAQKRTEKGFGHGGVKIFVWLSLAPDDAPGQWAVRYETHQE